MALELPDTVEFSVPIIYAPVLVDIAVLQMKISWLGVTPHWVHTALLTELVQRFRSPDLVVMVQSYNIHTFLLEAVLLYNL